MFVQIEKETVPDWLQNILDGGKPRFNLDDITRSSAYYPACAFDGEPVRHLVGHVHSFIYADDDWDIEMFLEENEKQIQTGFKGYHVVHREDVFPHLWPHRHVELELLPEVDHGRRRMWRWADKRDPWGQWTVWKRNKDADPTLPAGFSLLYLRGEMSAVYQEIYTQAKRFPMCFCLIRPGGFGGEWENALQKDSFIHTVMRSNPAGLPPYLMASWLGTLHDTWPEYPRMVCKVRHLSEQTSPGSAHRDLTDVKLWGM